MLGFEGEAGAAFVLVSLLAGAAVEEIAAVELQAGLGGVDPHPPPAFWIIRLGRQRGSGATAAIEHIVEVVAAGEVQLRVVGADAFADGRGTGEVERRTRDRGQGADGY